MFYSRSIVCLVVFITGCATPAVTDQDELTIASAEPAICEVMYAAHPHEKATQAIGVERLKQTSSFSFAEMTAFSHELVPATQKIADRVAAASGDSLEVLGQELVLGGYEGETIPSVVIRTLVSGKSGYEALLRMAANIGYVYAQDSTLVICAGDPIQGWQKVTSLEVSDIGNEEFFTEINVPFFFGMMIGAFNGPDNLGYTFYKDSKIFSTLATSGRAPGEAPVIEELADWVNKLSNGDVEFEISSRSVRIFFPHNDWALAPNGEIYQSYMIDEEVSEIIEMERQQYLEYMDEFLGQRMVQ